MLVKLRGKKPGKANIDKKMKYHLPVYTYTLCLNWIFIFAIILTTLSNNFEVFMAENLRPEEAWGSMAGSWARCRFDQVVNPDPDG